MANKNNTSSAPTNSREMLQQTQRLLTWSAYHESLKDVDQRALEQFQLTVSSLRAVLWVRVGIYIAQFIIVSVALVVGLYEVMQSPSENYVALGVLFVSFLLLIILILRNPVQSLNRILVDLARIQIILQGFTRQINQIDATFKQAFLEKKVGISTVTKSLGQIQQVIDGNVESLLQFLEEMQY